MLPMGKALIAAGLLFVSVLPAPAQTARFRWQAGQDLVYRVDHVTTASEVVSGAKIETSSKLNNVKRWQVLDVDAQGVATVQLSMKSLRMEIKSPEGETLVYDSENLDKSTAQLREQLSRYLNQPIALLRVDARGRVVEVKECKHGPASVFESEPPFVIVLPEEAIRPGQAWERAYSITLEPPQGTGEKYEAGQKYVCQSAPANALGVTFVTGLKTQPATTADQVPLLQKLPTGEVIFDVQNGRMHSVRLKIDKELKDHQGEGSSYRFQSTYAEEYVGAK